MRRIKLWLWRLVHLVTRRHVPYFEARHFKHQLERGGSFEALEGTKGYCLRCGYRWNKLPGRKLERKNAS